MFTGPGPPFAQRGYGIRFEWGAEGAAAVTEPAGAVVVVDVLSFSTAVAVATQPGTAVYPHPWPSSEVEAFAAARNAAYAVRRSLVDDEHPWSLSPVHLLAAPYVEKLVLPSPNGSAISAGTSSGTVVAGSLRNAAAVGRWLSHHGFGQQDRPVAVIAAGERWPGDRLRPALEDLLGAGAVISAIARDVARSPEAAAAQAAWEACRDHVAENLERCSSGQELIGAGYGGDVVLAAEYGSQDVVPVTEGAFLRAQ